jgi:hypothetical protein
MPRCICNRFVLGEEKPQPFITLDIDRQVDGKLVTSNQLNMNAPNGRLPMSSNYPGTGLLPLPSYLSQPQLQPNAISSLPMLDGGVYQGHSQMPTATLAAQSNNWNSNSIVSRTTMKHVRCFQIHDYDLDERLAAIVHAAIDESTQSRILSKCELFSKSHAAYAL